MRVLIVNTSEKTGGAALAAGRLMEALNKNGVKARMLVADKHTGSITVTGMGGGMLARRHFLWERWCIFCHLHFRRKRLFEIDIANAGFDITKTREFIEADIIHLNYINQGMLSLAGLRKILNSGKPVVWTMHDVWPATAICHYTRGCRAFAGSCHHCRLLPGGGGPSDLAARVWKKKAEAMRGHNMQFVACSRWLRDEAKASALLAGQKITAIPNPIDTQVFRPMGKAEARRAAGLPERGRIILFVSQRVTDKRKGVDYLIEALAKMVERRPDMRRDTAVAILGGHAEELVERMPLPAFPLGYVADARRIVAVYNSADVFVLPSVEDNLPNTVMEAMACGVPCVGFRIGGVPEMIDHMKNGYVAAPADTADMAEGMAWAIDANTAGELSAEAVRKVATCYSQHSVAMRYIEVYNEAMAFKRYKI